MRLSFPSLIAFFMLSFLLCACKDPNEYRVASSFAEYLARFKAEAANHNQTIDPERSGLIIEFANLKNGNAGLTHFETPIRIEIDKTYWNALSAKAGADLMKEQIIFHELGHGFLKRKHLNSVLENDDWKSIMCGGTKVNNRSWNVNYRGIRRAYYIDELFDENTNAPDFSSLQFPINVDSTGYKRVIQLNFNTSNNEDVGFPLEKNTQFETTLDSARLKFQSFADLPYMVFAKAPSPINIQNDFSFECTIECRTGNGDAQYGLVFGTRIDATAPTASESIEYLTITNNKRLFVGNRTWYSFYSELNNTNIRNGGKNKIKVLKAGQMLYYFINNVYAYCVEIEATKFGNYVGFLVPPKATAYLDDFTISQKNIAITNIKQNAFQLSNFQFFIDRVAAPAAIRKQ